MLSKHGMMTPLHVPSLFLPPAAAAAVASGSLLLLGVVAVPAREGRPLAPSEYAALLSSPADMPVPVPFSDMALGSQFFNLNLGGGGGRRWGGGAAGPLSRRTQTHKPMQFLKSVLSCSGKYSILESMADSKNLVLDSTRYRKHDTFPFLR